MPKTLLLFAHPDDEVVALGARLGRFGGARFAYATDGAPRNEQDSRAHGFRTLDDYRKARAAELMRVLSGTGIPEENCEWIGIPDQEASLRLPELTRSVVQLLRRHEPEVMFTHPYEGGHPDHDACAFAVHHAAALQTNRHGRSAVILEGTFYHSGPKGIATGSFLPVTQPTREAAYRLTQEERRRKRGRLDCFTSQRETLSGIPLDYERFRIAPEYDFTRPPHSGPVLYDMHPWGMTSQRFCELAQAAEDALQAESAWD
jgi:LmbE family N-acetylglucosaminyl deacetylase